MAQQFAIRRATIFIKIDEFGHVFELPVRSVSLIDNAQEFTIKAETDWMSFEQIAPEKRIDVTAKGTSPKLRLMVNDRGSSSSHQLGTIPLTRLEVATVGNVYVAHAPLDSWYEVINPPKKKEVTTEEALLSAVNTSIWLPVMAWRDYLIEIDAKEDVIWGLTWLIDHKKFPEEGKFSTDTFSGTAYRWLLMDDNGYAAHRLPHAVRHDIEKQTRYPTPPYTRLAPMVFKTIHEAFWTAAVSIGKNRDRLEIPKDSSQNAVEEDDDLEQPDEWDSDWPEPEDDVFGDSSS